MQHPFLPMLFFALIFSLYPPTVSAQEEYDKQDDCTFAMQMYDGDELLSQVLLDAVDSTGHPYAYLLVNGRVWDPHYEDVNAGLYYELGDKYLCRCAYGQFPFTFFPDTQKKNDRTSLFESRRSLYTEDELRYYYFKRSQGNSFALYVFDGTNLYYSTMSSNEEGKPYIVGDGNFQIKKNLGRSGYYNDEYGLKEGYEIAMELLSRMGLLWRDPIPNDKNIAYWDKVQKRINTFRFQKGSPETLSINTLKPEKANITLTYDATAKVLYLNDTDRATVRLYTAGGQMYKEYRSTGTVHLEDLPHGVYIAKAIAENGRTAVKSIVI